MEEAVFRMLQRLKEVYREREAKERTDKTEEERKERIRQNKSGGRICYS